MKTNIKTLQKKLLILSLTLFFDQATIASQEQAPEQEISRGVSPDLAKLLDRFTAKTILQVTSNLNGNNPLKTLSSLSTDFTLNQNRIKQIGLINSSQIFQAQQAINLLQTSLLVSRGQATPLALMSENTIDELKIGQIAILNFALKNPAITTTDGINLSAAITSIESAITAVQANSLVGSGDVGSGHAGTPLLDAAAITALQNARMSLCSSIKSLNSIINDNSSIDSNYSPAEVMTALATLAGALKYLQLLVLDRNFVLPAVQFPVIELGADSL